MKPDWKGLSTLGVILVIPLMLAPPAVTSDFVWGGFATYADNPTDSTYMSWYTDLGFNSIYAIVRPAGSDTCGIDLFAAESLTVYAANGDNASVSDTSWLYMAGRQGHLIHWEAEDEISVPLCYGVTTRVVHHQGVKDPTETYWCIEPGVDSLTPGIADWELREHYQQKVIPYTALFYMKIDTIGSSSDAVAEIYVIDTVPATGTHTILCQDTIYAGQFPGNDSVREFLAEYNAGISAGPWSSNIAIHWLGTRKLYLDSVVMFNDVGGQLVRDQPSWYRESIRVQCSSYAATCLPGTTTPALRWWHGMENHLADDKDSGTYSGNPYIDNLEIAKYLDSLAQTYGQGYMWDRNLGSPRYYAGEDDHWMSLDPRDYIMWCYAVPSSPPDSTDIEAMQAIYDTLATALFYSDSLTAVHDKPLHYVVQAYATDTVDSLEVGLAERPTHAEIKCLSFLGICYGVDGLWYWPYDESRGPLYRGLVYQRSRSDTAQLTHKYHAVKEAVWPIVDLYAALRDHLTRQGAGRLDLIAGAGAPGWCFVDTAVTLNLNDDYVEAGFFEDPTDGSDLLVLVNRNTSTGTTTDSLRQLVLSLDPSKLASPSQNHYYMIDLKPDYQSAPPDTLLAGPLGGVIKYYTEIEPGGIKLIKIAPAPQYVSGPSFPKCWWGTIQADDNLTLNVGQELTMLPGTTFKMLADTPHSSFTIRGRLIARGTSDSAVTFTHKKVGALSGWRGLNFLRPQACSLSNVVIAQADTSIKSLDATLALEQVVTSGTQVLSVHHREMLDSLTSLSFKKCDFDRRIDALGGSLFLADSCILRARDTVIHYVADSRRRGDALTVFASHFPDVGCMGVLCDGVAPGLVVFDGITMKGSGTGLKVEGDNIMLLYSSVLDSLDVAVDVDSSRLTVAHTSIHDAGHYGIYALDGAAEIYLDTNVVITGRPNTTVGVGIGTGGNLVAYHSQFENGYIGIETRGDRQDSIVHCRFMGNSLYGVWFNQGNSTGDSADYSADNVIENDTASALNVGLQVLQQSLKSQRDSVKGGYNWVFNINTYNTTNKKVEIHDAVVLGKAGDDWGLVLNGISSSYDTAVVTDPVVLNNFSQAHMYLRHIHAEVTGGLLESANDNSASPVGVYAREYTTGFFGCTRIIGQFECVKRLYNTSSIWWTDEGSPFEDAGYNEFSTDLTLTFANYAADTVDARHNFWGQSPPETSQIYGPVNYSSWLDSTGCGQGGYAARIASVAEVIKPEFALLPNYPNPFNPETRIDYSLAYPQPVSVSIYNVLGRLVRRFDPGQQAAGVHSLIWDGRSADGTPVGSGVYFYRMETPVFRETRKMLLVK